MAGALGVILGGALTSGPGWEWVFFINVPERIQRRSLRDAGGGYVSDTLGPSLIWGLGLGIGTVVVIAAATDDLGGEGESGLASGLVNTTMQVGRAIGLAALSTLAFNRVDDAMAGAKGNPDALPGALTEGFELALYLGAGLAALGAVIALLALTGRAAPEHIAARRGGPPAKGPVRTPVLRMPLPEQADQGPR